MHSIYACASIAIISSLCSLTILRASQPLVEVPFELVEQHLIVAKGVIGGLRGLNLLIDTGTIPSIVDKRIASKLGVRGVPSLMTAFGQTVRFESATIAGLRIGPYEPGDVPAGIGDLSYLQGTRIHAIVGLDVLARQSFRIDYAAQTLSFAPRDRESAAARLRVVWPFVTVQLIVAGQPIQLLVDTGSRDLVLFRRHMPAPLLPVPWKGDKVVYHATGAARLLKYELRQVTLGDQHWESLPGFVLDAKTDQYPPGIDGVLGVRALGASRVQFDFERGELGWTR